MFKCISILAMAMMIISQAFCIETHVFVRARAKDAKFLGSSIGGAHVIIRNKFNQQILAEGKTAGTPGNTAQVMDTARGRYAPLADEAAAKFDAVLNISEPTLVRIEVLAPANHRQSQINAAVEMWVIPGKHITGDGVILEIPGFIIDILSPRTHNFMRLSSPNTQPLTIQANIVMMCGCIIQKGGLWNGDKMEVKAIVKKNGQLLQEATMTCVADNLFEGKLPVTEKGEYQVTVYAFDERSGNTGVDIANFVVL